MLKSTRNGSGVEKYKYPDYGSLYYNIIAFGQQLTSGEEHKTTQNTELHRAQHTAGYHVGIPPDAVP